ncbi:hypothetical protein GCM10007989_12900 [Devosia pacifica]|uniref:DUF1468 domain-containing protein n=1 Tax=Devosia pacifica TaxID=1335967 RepID=A0A918S3H3_9HYPH|nr:tripartite tricarboxylate transporter TctB family protein [Devosia pacifica]GHA18941.1 hypothetical protein GCM10007989_12900 [Devosia pacifica]
MSRLPVARTDLACGLFITILGAGALVESLRMPRFEERNADPFTVPGLTPGFVSVVLLILGAALLLRALSGRTATSQIGTGVTITQWNRGSVVRTVLTLAAVLTYGLLLFGHFPFVPVTAAFIFAFTVGAELIAPERQLSLLQVLLGAAVLAIAGAFTLHFVFTDIFLVRLPGGRWW